MKKKFKNNLIPLLLLFLPVWAVISAGSLGPGKDELLSLHYASMISMDSLQYMVRVLASDTLDGRETGTEGEFEAAYFLARLHASNFVMPGLENYMQEFEVINPGRASITISTDRQSFSDGVDFLSLFPHDSAVISDDEIIYVGYGIEDPSWNDYAYKDVKGKIVLAKEGEPKDNFGINILTATERLSEWSADPIHSYILKRNAAMRNGAKAFLYFAPESFDMFRDIYERIQQTSGQATATKADTLYDFIINENVLQELTGYQSLDDVYYTGRRDRAWPVPITIHYNNKLISYFSQNVIAKVEGRDEAEGIILVIANHDHLGRVNDSVYYPGANNNATGVSSLIEIAKAFQKAADDGYFMKRSLYFISFSGREKNHIGVKYFFKNMPFSKEDVYAVIDLDRLGYLDTISVDPTVIYLAVNEDNPAFFKRLKVFRKVGPKMKVKEISHSALYKNPLSASDGVLFYNENYPVYTFNSGGRYPYNRTPEDTPDKISWDVYLQRTRYVFLSTWILANE